MVKFITSADEKYALLYKTFSMPHHNSEFSHFYVSAEEMVCGGLKI
jgi:hypothetical protein